MIRLEARSFIMAHVHRLQPYNKLWILRPKGYDDKKGDPTHGIDPLWKPWYDKSFGFIVCAPDEETARQLAFIESGAEEPNRYEHISKYIKVAWSAEHSTCEQLVAGPEVKVIIQDFQSA